MCVGLSIKIHMQLMMAMYENISRHLIQYNIISLNNIKIPLLRPRDASSFRKKGERKRGRRERRKAVRRKSMENDDGDFGLLIFPLFQGTMKGLF